MWASSTAKYEDIFIIRHPYSDDNDPATTIIMIYANYFEIPDETNVFQPAPAATQGLSSRAPPRSHVFAGQDFCLYMSSLTRYIGAHLQASSSNG